MCSGRQMPKKVLDTTRNGIEKKPWCNDIMSITCTFGLPSTGWTSDDRTGTQDSKQNGQSNVELIVRGTIKKAGTFSFGGQG